MKTNLRKRLLKWCPQPRPSGSTPVTRLATNHKRSKILYALPIAALTLIAVIVAFWFFMSLAVPIATPRVLFHENITVINQGVSSISGFNGAFDNVPQGATLQFIMDFESLTEKPITIQIESLRMTYYNSSVDAKQWIVSDPNQYANLQRSALNYSFSLNPVIVQPSMSNSTILTMNLAQDAPTGEYTFEINTGLGDFGIMIIVVPNANS